MSATPTFDRQARRAFIVACVTLAMSAVVFRVAVGYLSVHLQKKPVDLRAHFNTISSDLGEWQTVVQGEPLTKEMVEELGTDLYLNRDLVRGDDKGPRIQLHLAYYTGMIDAVPHVPDRCVVAAGFDIQAMPKNYPIDVGAGAWPADPAASDRDGVPYPFVEVVDAVTGRPQTVHMPIGDFAIRTTEFSHPKQLGRRVYGGYFFIANGGVAVTPEDVKKLAFRLSEEYAYYCKVQFFAHGDREFEIDEFLEQASDLIESMLPELMRCLPDWAEVESRTEPDRDATESQVS